MGRTKKKIKNVDVAIVDFDFDTLLEFARQSRNKRNSYSFLEEYKNQSESDVAKTIRNVLKMLMKCTEKYLDGNSAEKWASSDPESIAMAGKLIQASVDIALATLQLKFHTTCHAELAVFLNGILPMMPDSLDNVKNSISQFCEKLSLTNASDKSELFLFNVFPYLIKKAMGQKVLKTDIKRVYAIRSKLGSVMILNQTNKEEMWHLFKELAEHAAYLSLIEGQKVVALSMTLDIDKMVEIHKVIRDMIPEMNIKYASAYGKVYFEAWCYTVKQKDEDLKNVMEISCLQDLMLMAIQTRRRHVMPIIRKILAEFHLYKKEQQVAKMLYFLYQPLLWRYIRNPSGLIRSNAAQLFFDIFPLEDPDVKIVPTHLELNDQLIIIRDLLSDDFPVVRITAVLGVCISLSVNWEVYPEEMIKSYFRIIVNDLSRDSSNFEVRCAVVKGLKCLLENPLTLRCLISFLPKLRGLIHDIHENVRIAFCQLLLRVKRISAIKYFDIVPLKDLIARMEEDCPTVQKVITNLLSNSYFPLLQDPKVWLGRCLEILKTHRNASRVLFTHMMHFIGVSACINFMCQSARAIHFYVKTKNAPVPTNLEICNKENIVNINEYMTSLEAAVGFSNLKTVSSLMDAVTIMWLSLKTDLERSENKSYLKLFVGRVGTAMADLALYYKDTEAWESVFFSASFIPANDVPTLGSLCFWKLKNLSHDAKYEDYITLLECLINQRQGLELMNLLKEWLEFGLSDSYVPPTSTKRRKRSKGGDNIYYDQPKPYLANQMLDTIISERCLQRCLMEYPKGVIDIVYLFDYIKRKLERFNAKLINETEASFLGLLLYNILRLALFLHYSHAMNGAKFINEIVEWTQQKLIPYLTFSEEGTDNFTSLIHTICMNLCRVLADAAGLGFVEPNSQVPLLYFEKLLTSELGYKYAVITARFLYKYTATSQYLHIVEDDTVMFEHLLTFLVRFLKHFCNETLLESIPALEYKDVQFTLGNVMHLIHNVVHVLKQPACEIYMCLLGILLDSVLEKTNVIVEELSDEPFEKITYPKVAAFFMFMVNQKPSVVPIYMNFLNELYNSSNPHIALWIGYWTILNNILGRKDLSEEILTETNILVCNLEKTIHLLYPRKGSSDADNSPDSSETPRMQIFQQHCHAEFLKLKNRQLSKVNAEKQAEKKK